MSINQNIAHLTDGSLNDLIDTVFNAYMDQYGGADWSSYPLDIFDDYLVARSEGKLFKVSYSMDADGNIEFAPAGEWIEVNLTYVEASLDPGAGSKFNLSEFVARIFKGSGANDNLTKGQENMEKEKEKEINAALPAADQAPDVVALVNGASEAELAQLATNPAIAKLIETRASAEIALQRKADDVAQFSRAIVRGDDNGSGLPVPADRLEKFLLSLDDGQLKEAKEILDHVAKTGLIALSEKGHNEIVTGTKPLPGFVQASLKMTLDSGGTVEEFFKANAAELGEMRDYDLSEFNKKADE